MKHLILAAQVVLVSIVMAAGHQRAEAQETTPVQRANYDLAERFSQKKVSKMVPTTKIRPNFFKNSNKFWYQYKDLDGTKYYIVDPLSGSKKEIWNMADLAAQITEITKEPYDAQHLPLQDLKLKDDKYFEFELRTSEMVPKKEKSKKTDADKKDEKKDSKPAAKEKRLFRFSYDINSGKITDISDIEKEKDYPRWANISPDGKYVLYSKEFNLWYMDMENLKKAMEDEKDSTIVEHQITTDGTKDFPYGRGNNDPYATKEDINKRGGASAVWSPDSKHFAIERNDVSNIKSLWVIDVLANPRPKLEAYKYQMPGEPSPKAYLYVFDNDGNGNFKGRTIKVDAFKDQTIDIELKEFTNKQRYDKYIPMVWEGDNNSFLMTRTSRDIKRVDICRVDLAADSAKMLIAERLNTYVETRNLKIVRNTGEMIHWSERDGWAHLYLYDKDGNLKHRLTKGEMHVEEILGVDEARRVVFFTACGVDKKENPYYKHIYSAPLDGSCTLKNLNPGDFDCEVVASDDAKVFVSNYSKVDCAPATAIYDNTGRKIADIEKADLSLLFAAGYKFPEIFTVKAGDGITDLYGVMYKPYDFDSTKTYPIIEYVYPGPQTEANNSLWSYSMDRIDRLAQVGFIVITVGNRGGHPNRSKWYHNYGYGNLRDYGLEDKKVAVQQLASRHKFIDENRVGIHGHSGGGFMSTAAILKYPHFFKAAVSCAGNHDNSIYNRWWSEQHHGIIEELSSKGDTTFRYSIATNQELASNLRGNLLLITGDIDNNVHPGNTLRVVDALIRANKRFDMLVLPGQRHGFGDMQEYFFWRMVDHFSKYLIGDYQDTVDIPQMHND